MADVHEITQEQAAQLATAFGEAIDRMSPQERDQLRVMAEQLVAGQAGADRLAEQLRAQGEAVALQKQASAILAAGDLKAHRAALEAQVPSARVALEAAEAAVREADARVTESIKAERHAADRFAEAERFWRQQRDAVEDLAAAEADPEAQVDALVRRDRAGEVAQRAQEKARAASEVHVTAEAEAETARGAVRRCRVAVRDAEAAAQCAPETARPSPVTILLAWPQLLADGADLTPDELGVVRGVIMAYAQQTGADKMIKQRAEDAVRAELRSEFDRALALVPAPTSGNIAMPLSGQRDPRGDWRR